MKENDIIFVNVVVDLVKCYCNDNGAEPGIIFNAISSSFNKEMNNGDEDKT